jgi:hypothetical protein
MSDISHNALSTRDQLRPVVKQWVGQTFYAPALKSARASGLTDGDSPLTGGRGGQAFGSLLDGHLAELAGSGSGGKLVDAVVDHLSPAGRA